MDPWKRPRPGSPKRNRHPHRDGHEPGLQGRGNVPIGRRFRGAHVVGPRQSLLRGRSVSRRDADRGGRRPRVENLIEAHAHGFGRAIEAVRLEEGISEQHLLVAVPASHLQPLPVVEVVRALALGDVAPRTGHVSRGEHVLKKVLGKSLEGQDPPRPGGGLGTGRIGIAACRQDHGRAVEEEVRRRRVGLGRTIERGVEIGEGVLALARHEEVRVVGTRARGVIRIGARERDLGRRGRVAPLIVARGGREGVGLVGRDGVLPEDELSLEHGIEQLGRRAGVIPADGRPSGEVHAIELETLGAGPGLGAESDVVPLPRQSPEPGERRGVLRRDSGDRVAGDRPVLGVDEGEGGDGSEKPGDDDGGNERVAGEAAATSSRGQCRGRAWTCRPWSSRRAPGTCG